MRQLLTALGIIALSYVIYIQLHPVIFALAEHILVMSIALCWQMASYRAEKIMRTKV